MPTTEQYLNEIIDQKKVLATNITAKGITASETEKLNILVPKVAQIENLKGEERTLENFTNVLSEPKSVVQLEYPEPKNLFDKDNANIIIGYPDAENVINPATTTRTVYIPCAPNTTYTVSKTVTARFCVAFADVLPASGVTVTGRIQNNTATSITATSSADSKYIVVWVYHTSYDTSITLDEILATLQIELGSTATTYEPYPAPKTLNAKLGSKNLIPYPYAETRTTIEGITVTYNSDNSIVFDGTATAQFWFKLFDNIPLPAGNYWLTGTPSGYGALKSFVYIYDSSGNAYNAYTTDGVLCALPANNYSGRIYVAAGQTFENVVLKPQLELGSTATAYTPYISDFSTTTVTRCGRNLIPSIGSISYYFGNIINGKPYVSSNTNTISSLTNIDVSAFRGVYTVKKLEEGKTYTLSLNGIVNNCSTKALFLTVGFRSSEDTIFGTTDVSSYKTSDSNATSLTFTVPSGKPYCLIGFYNYPTALGDTISLNAMQVEFGSTATNYEPYQGQTYTPTATGEVTGITNLYPLTTLITNNAGVVFEQVTGQTYKEILPSTDKNGMTKVLQPAVDSTIDSNITSDNIKKDVSILGVTGDYICNYTYDETSKELVLLI